VQQPTQETSPRLIRLPEVLARTGLSRSQAYSLAGQSRFPRPIKLSERCAAWVESEVEAWIRERMAQREAA
jgi:prophage regulatory protein